MRIGWTSNAPWAATGYSIQTAEVVRNLVKDAHEVAIMANFGLGGAPLHWENIPVFPTGMDAYSNDVTPGQMQQWFAGNQEVPALAITLYDTWVYTSPDWDQFPIASWTPVDHKVVPHGVKAWFDRKGKGKWAIAMSKFGEQELLEMGMDKDDLFYAPHSYDPAIYKPYDLSMRKEINVPEDAHLTIVASANKGSTPVRKSFSELITAWAEWAKNKDDAYLYLHTDAFGIASGVHLVNLLNALSVPESKVRIVPQLHYRMNIPAPTVAKLYAASDVLLMPSRGEGFGVPLIEAQACGTPVITTDWTAMTELCGSGWLVEGQVEYDHHQGGWWKVPFISSIKDALQASYEQSKDEKAAEAGKEKALTFAKDYATSVVYDTHWRPILKELEGRLTSK